MRIRKIAIEVLPGDTTLCISVRLMDKAIVKFCRTHDIVVLGEMHPNERRAYVVSRILEDYVGEVTL